MKKNKRLSKIMAVVLAALMVLSTGASTVLAATTDSMVAAVEGRKSETNAIVSQPQETTVTEGETAVFSVETEGEVKSYQWQYNTTGSARGWKNITTNETAGTDTLSVRAVLADNGTQYRVSVKFQGGRTFTSESTKLWVSEKVEETEDDPTEPVETEPVEEPTEPVVEEVKMPAVEFAPVQAGNVLVNVSAPEGAFPEGTEMSATAVTNVSVLPVFESSTAASHAIS